MRLQYKHQIAALAEATCDAYSYDRYRSWSGCVRMLKRHGLTDKQTEAVLRSKWTRWAADASGKPYGRATSTDLQSFVFRQSDWRDAVERLTRESFPEGWTA